MPLVHPAPGTFKRAAEQLRATSKYRTDPAAWAHESLGELWWSKQIEIAQSVVENRYTAVQSCHDAGKSYIASRLAAWWIKTHPPGEAFVVTTAPTAPQVRTILWREIGRAHRLAGLPGKITAGAVPEWKVGGEIVAYGRKPADYDQAAFQGIHAKYVLVIIDEACGVPKSLYDAADALVTNEHARMIAIGNPDNPQSYFQKICTPGNDEYWGNTIRISAFDWFAEMERSAHLKEFLISPIWVEERRKRWGENSALWASKVLGEFPDESDMALITPAMLEKAHILDLPGRVKGHYGLDVARYGDDSTECYRNRGGVIRHEWSMRKASTMVTADRMIATLKPDLGQTSAVIDTIGIGAGVFDRVRQVGLPVTDFNASERASEPERFINRRAEAFWGLRELMDDSLIDLDREDFDLSNELLGLEYEIKNGRIAMQSKEDMRKKGKKSPNRADAVMMAATGKFKPGAKVDVPLPVAPITDGLLNEPT